MKDTRRKSSRLWLLCSFIAIVACLTLATVAVQQGIAAWLLASAERSSDIAATNKALRMTPKDPDAHLLRAQLFETEGELARALTEYETAASLRPDDYVMWMLLARARELNGNPASALEAARYAVQMAPSYAQPRWQLGNLLVRGGEVDQGFAELRAATRSDPSFLAATIDLASQLARGDAQLIINLLQPEQAETYRAVANHFRRQGDLDTALVMLRAAGDDPDNDQGRRQLLFDLIAAKKFNQAFDLWRRSSPTSRDRQSGSIDDGGFEHETDLQVPGFGWRAENSAETLKRTLDATDPREEKFSLQIEFGGDADPGSAIISQLVKTEPHHSYQLSFAFRSADLVTGGLPKLSVLDGRTNAVLATTEPFPRTSNGWQNVTLKFVSGEPDSAIRIVLTREPCATAPCPIFGRLWLDGFSLRSL